MMLTRLIMLLVFLGPLPVWAQTEDPLPASNTPRDVATAELEAVIAESGKLSDKLEMIRVKAKAAALIAVTDPIRSEAMFMELWKFTKQQDETQFDKERALSLIVKYAYPRNPQLAKQLLASEQKSNESSLELRATGRDPNLSRMVKLASQLMDENPRAASEFLGQSLPNGMSPAGLTALFRLREREPLLSDSVVSKTIEGLRSQADVISLSGLQMLAAYAYPEGNFEVSSSLDALQVQYFSASLEAMRASLSQTETSLRDRNYSQADLRFRSLYQARLSLTLAALAPRYRPDLAVELRALADKLRLVLPDNVLQLSRITTDRLAGVQTIPDDPERAFALAMSNGDFDTARSELERFKSADKKNVYTQLLIKSEVRALLAKSELMEAVTAIRKLEDPTTRLVMYMDAIKAANSKRDAEVSRVIINEARLLIPQTDRNGLHLRALLSFTSQLAKLGATDDALEFLKSAVSTINSLGPAGEESASKSLAESAMAKLNDPNSLLDEPEMERVFVAVGLLDLDLGLTQAKKIQPKPVQLMARLLTIQGVIKQAASKPKPKAPPVKVAPRVDSSKP
jgi:hypothetical protein